MSAKAGLPRGAAYALAAAVLFGLSTPAAKRLLGDLHPVLLVGFLYAGSGLGLSLSRLVRKTRPEAALTRRDAPWLAGAVFFGGVPGPVVLLFGGAASAVNLAVAGALGLPWPSVMPIASSLAVGFLGYGVSLALFVLALRHVGAARAGPTSRWLHSRARWRPSSSSASLCVPLSPQRPCSWERVSGYT